MEQVIPQSQTGRNAAASRRMGWFMAVILALVLGAAATLAWFNINMAETALKRDVERHLQLTAQEKANELSLWFNSLQSQTTRLISADLFRLFASEVNELGSDIGPLLKASGEGASGGGDDTSQLASQLPLMRNLLQEFVSYSGFLSGRLTNADGQTYLSTEVTPPSLSLEQKQAVRDTIQKGVIGILPVRKASSGLVMDMVVPIFAPQYVENRSDQAVATLMLSVMVTSRLGETIESAKAGSSFGETRVFQIVDGTLQDLLPLSAEIRPVPAWKLEDASVLPFEIREGIVSHEKVYSLGVKVPELPWIVVEDVAVDNALKPFWGKRNEILIWAVISVVVVLLALLAVWWWLVGRSARSVNAELLHLYQVSSQQKQLLDGKAIIADVELADGRKSKAFVQIDPGTKQVMYVPTPIIGRNLQVLSEELHLDATEVRSIQQGNLQTLVVDNNPVTVGIDLNAKTAIRLCPGDERKWREQSKREWDKYTFGCYGCWVMDDDGNLDYVPEEDYSEELWNEQKKSGERNRASALHK